MMTSVQGGVCSNQRSGTLEIVDHSAYGLDVGVLGLPFVVAAVVAALYDVHAAAEVWLLVHDPAAKTRVHAERQINDNPKLHFHRYW